ncbi:hypothetical protein COI63_28275, partial [Bacillus toyonensis]
MNRNYPNNEYEIMNNNEIHQPRYPLAEAPGSELQRMNYTDWMKRCAGGEPEDLFSNSNAIRNGIIIGTSIVTAILSVSSPLAAATTGIIAVLLPYLWPETPATIQAQFTWDQLMSAAGELIDNRISDLVRTNAINTLRILQSRIRDYQQAICNLKADPNNEAYKADVRREFNDAEDQAKSVIIELQSNGYEISLLASYAQAANLHLLLLRDVVKYGESWGFSFTEVQQYYSNTSAVGNPGMLQLLATYTDYCVNWYNTGVNNLKQQAGLTIADWNKVNDFRRDMTIMVLDIVSLWPTYNPRIYAQPTKSQLTRSVYTPMSGQVFRSIEAIDNEIMPPPSLFSWLREVTLFRRAFPVSTNEYALFTQYAGYKMSFQNTLNPTLQETPISGERGDEVNSVRIGEEPNLEVYKMQNILLGSGASRDFESPQTFDFHFTPSGTVERVGINYANIQGEPTSATNQGLACNNNSSEPCDPCTSVTPCSVGPINTTIPCDSLTYYSHRLSRIGGVMGANPQSIIGLTYGWTHVSADRTNTIETEKITQIPAVKGRKLEGDVIKGPGSTGGDLVKLYPVYGRNQLQIYLNIPARTNNISGYKIRIRYASKQSTDIGVELERTINPQWRRSTILATYSGDN